MKIAVRSRDPEIASTSHTPLPGRNKHRGAGGQVRVTIVALRALASGPHTAIELARTVGTHWRAAYRLIGNLRGAGLPIEDYGVAPRGPRGGGPHGGGQRYRIATDALLQWIAEGSAESAPARRKRRMRKI